MGCLQSKDEHLLVAARVGDCAALKAALMAGAAVNASDVEHQTALLWAAHGGHTACVRLLCDAGADADTADQARMRDLA